jgi:UDP-glucose 4-epimerase
VVLRIFNAYGPGQNLPPSHPPVVPRFLQQAVRGGTLVVFGGGNQTRDFVYVDDVVDAMVAAATAPDADRRIINIGSGQETSVNDLARLVLEIVGRDVEVIHSPAQGGGVSRLCADITLARRLLNYRPRVSLEEGLRRTLKLDPRFAV